MPRGHRTPSNKPKGRGKRPGGPTESRRKYERFGQLVDEAIRKRGLSVVEVAKRTGIHPTLLSQIRTARNKRPRSQNVVALATLLGLERQELLVAAGYEKSKRLDVSASNLILTRVDRSKPQSLYVVTDPRFIDSALFMWIFSKQPFDYIGLECVPYTTAWKDVPAEVAQHDQVIGFFNRMGISHSVDFWVDLCLYRGYALLAPPSAGTAKPPVTLSDAQAYLRELVRERGRRLRVLCMGADAVWRLIRHFMRTDELEPVERSNPDAALREFLNGESDLFVGGLSQRLAAEKAGCIPIVSFDNDPTLFSLNSLICSEHMFREHQTLLSYASALWFQEIPRLTKDKRRRDVVVNETLEFLEGQLGVSDHSLSPGVFDDALSSDRYEIFPDRPTKLLDLIAEIAATALSKDASMAASVLQSLTEALNPPRESINA